ncbi:MAG: 3-dehydroquinate dehydratase [Clostridia bacterium]|nr:3-dehydroquinate dehydratase [Clostridia bacterium]
MKFWFINGVNLNMTGTREKSVYGEETLGEINEEIKEHFKGDDCVFFQSNIEGEIVNAIEDAAADGADGIILNAGAFTHYSYAIRDAISSVDVPVAEVHMSNVYSREEFRHTSVLSPVCRGVVAGFGKKSYILAAESFKS